MAADNNGVFAMASLTMSERSESAQRTDHTQKTHFYVEAEKQERAPEAYSSGKYLLEIDMLTRLGRYVA